MSEEPLETERALDIEIQETENRKKRIKNEIKSIKNDIKLWMTNDTSIFLRDDVSQYQIVLKFLFLPHEELLKIKEWVESKGYKFNYSRTTKKISVESPETLNILRKTYPDADYSLVDITDIPKYKPVQLFCEDIQTNKQYTKLCRDIQYLHDTVGHISYVLQGQNEKIEVIVNSVNDIGEVIKNLNKNIKEPNNTITVISEFFKEMASKLANLIK